MLNIFWFSFFVFSSCLNTRQSLFRAALWCVNMFELAFPHHFPFIQLISNFSSRVSFERRLILTRRYLNLKNIFHVHSPSQTSLFRCQETWQTPPNARRMPQGVRKFTKQICLIASLAVPLNLDWNNFGCVKWLVFHYYCSVKLSSWFFFLFYDAFAFSRPFFVVGRATVLFAETICSIIFISNAPAVYNGRDLFYIIPEIMFI
jgi:hypothetical protein